jgi:hypothetical protein
MLSKKALVRAAALTGALALMGTALPLEAALAQQAPSVALEQARKGEDGSSNAGAGSGNMSSGTASRDKNGNGGNANAGSAGEVATADGSSGSGAAPAEGEAAPLPENAELLDRLGILDDVTTYGIDVLVGMDIPVELLPEQEPAATTSTAPADVNTGGQGTSGAPAGGSTSAATEDGTGEKTRDRPRKDKAAADGSTEGSTEGSTDGTTATDSATGSDGN